VNSLRPIHRKSKTSGSPAGVRASSSRWLVYAASADFARDFVRRSMESSECMLLYRSGTDASVEKLWKKLR